MPMICTSTSDEALGAFKCAIDLGKIGIFEVGAPGEIKNRTQLLDDMDKLEDMKYHYQVQESVVRSASHDNQVARVQGLVGWLDRLKRAIEMLKMLKKKCASHGKQAKNVKPRRRGFYMFLYGGRVDLDTFYDYKGLPRDGRF